MDDIMFDETKLNKVLSKEIDELVKILS